MPDHDFIANQAEMLGITLSDKNFVKSLWDKYCSTITDLSQSVSEADEPCQKSLESGIEWEDNLSDKDKILAILNAIQDNQEPLPAATSQEQLDWIEQQITILYRLKGDLELGLRYTSNDEAVKSD